MFLLQLAQELHTLPNWREEYVWHEGFTDWVRAGAIPELQIVPPPFPARPQPPTVPESPIAWGLWNVLLATAGALLVAGSAALR